MSEQSNDRHPLGWLLLRDGHAIPITGLEPVDLKEARRRAVPFPETPLKHTSGLNAIVDTLGFDGDFGDYSHTHWRELSQFLLANGCRRPTDAFSRTLGAMVFFFDSSVGRQDLAERYFLGPQPPPQRVFLGTDVDWDGWMDHARRTPPRSMLLSDEEFVPKDHEEAVTWVLSRRTGFMGQWGFMDDKLVDGPVAKIVDKSYFPRGMDLAERHASHRKLSALLRVFRHVFDRNGEGWADLLRFNDHLAIIRTLDGGYDLIWRNLRSLPPPGQATDRMTHGLHIVDLPATLAQGPDLARRLYFRPNVWHEAEAHAAEQHFYDRGGSSAERRQIGEAEVIEIYLRDKGTPTVVQHSAWAGVAPDGFAEEMVEGQRLLVSALVTVGEFRRMLGETGYLDRREGDEWERANAGEPDDAPVGASWMDAQAFCAWRERQLGVGLRLLSTKEHRVLRPFESPHYATLALQDFPWEYWPPRRIASLVPPTAVRWSEPRFEEPSPDVPELPDDEGFGSAGRKRWITDFPPRARWVSELPWTEHHGLDFIDAWDAYEWCQEVGWMAGRYWEGPISAACWGAYKNVKVGFRLAMVGG